MRPVHLFSQHTRQRGFTLIELIMVLVVIGVLAVFVLPSFRVPLWDA